MSRDRRSCHPAGFVPSARDEHLLSSGAEEGSESSLLDADISQEKVYELGKETAAKKKKSTDHGEIFKKKFNMVDIADSQIEHR